MKPRIVVDALDVNRQERGRYHYYVHSTLHGVARPLKGQPWRRPNHTKSIYPGLRSLKIFLPVSALDLHHSGHTTIGTSTRVYEPRRAMHIGIDNETYYTAHVAKGIGNQCHKPVHSRTRPRGEQKIRITYWDNK